MAKRNTKLNSQRKVRYLVVFVLIKTYENIPYTVTAWYQRNEAKPMKMKIAKETVLDYLKGAQRTYRLWPKPL